MNERILVIDDEEGIRYVFKWFLTQEGYDVDTAGDYNEAISLITQKDFALIFTDFFLKEMTGIDVLKKVKEKDSDCPVVMITGRPTPETDTDARRLGAFDYLSKPVLRETILNVTRSALQHRALHLIRKYINEKPC